MPKRRAAEVRRIDLSTRDGRRRFFLDRMQRRLKAGRGSDFALLMTLPLRPFMEGRLDAALGVPYAAIGGVAVRLYVPERTTLDLDVLVRSGDVAAARASLGRVARRRGDLAFPDTTLGLSGETWQLPDAPPLDVITSEGAWVERAIAGARRDATGLPIAPRAVLIALKLDASRGVDQGDLTRLLGTASEAELDDVRALIADVLPQDVEDLESYVTLGRLEIGEQRVRPRDERPT